MQRLLVTALLAGASALPATAEPLSILPYPEQARPAMSAPAPVRYAAAQPRMGGGFIEFLFGNGAAPPPAPFFHPGDAGMARPDFYQPIYGRGDPMAGGDPARMAADPRYRRQLVDYNGKEAAGTVIISTNDRFLYLVEGN